MSVVNILAYVGLIGYVLLRKVRGQPLKTGKELFALPIVLIVVGYGDVSSGGSLTPVLVVLTALGGVASLGLGMLRGRADKLSTRDGVRFVSWGATSLALFVTNLAIKLALDLVGVATGGSSSSVTKSLIFTLGLTLTGEALVLFMRTGGTEMLNQSRPPGHTP